MASGMKRVSTHVLDLALGKPAQDVTVRFEKQEGSGWSLLTTERTDPDGRCGQLLPQKDIFSPGWYRLSFDTGRYYAGQSISALFPVIEIIFQVREGETQFHIPLLLSSHGYTTYRGS
jgi:5-hydroxyisourate hydrolase